MAQRKGQLSMLGESSRKRLVADRRERELRAGNRGEDGDEAVRFLPTLDANDPETFILGAAAMLSALPGRGRKRRLRSDPRHGGDQQIFLARRAARACEREMVWRNAVVKREAERKKTREVLDSRKAAVGLPEHQRVVERFEELTAAMAWPARLRRQPLPAPLYRDARPQRQAGAFHEARLAELANMPPATLSASLAAKFAPPAPSEAWPGPPVPEPPEEPQWARAQEPTTTWSSDADIRVFPRRTKATPVDRLAYCGPPDLFAEADEVHVSVAFTADKAIAERLAEAWRVVAPVKIGGVAYGDASLEFIPAGTSNPATPSRPAVAPGGAGFAASGRNGPEANVRPSMTHNMLDDNLLGLSARPRRGGLRHAAASGPAGPVHRRPRGARPCRITRSICSRA